MEVFQSIDAILRHAGVFIYAIVLIVLFVEEAGLPIPFLPGDTLLLITGYQISRGRVSFALALPIVLLAASAGAFVLYRVSRRYGHPLLDRFLRFVDIDPKPVARGERWLQAHPFPVILAGRLLPGCRAATSLTCGTFLVSQPIFLTATALGTAVWATLFLGLGAALGRSLWAMLPLLHLPPGITNMLFVTVAAGWLGFVAWRWLRRRKREGSAPSERPEH